MFVNAVCVSFFASTCYQYGGFYKHFRAMIEKIDVAATLKGSKRHFHAKFLLCEAIQFQIEAKK